MATSQCIHTTRAYTQHAHPQNTRIHKTRAYTKHVRAPGHPHALIAIMDMSAAKRTAGNINEPVAMLIQLVPVVVPSEACGRCSNDKVEIGRPYSGQPAGHPFAQQMHQREATVKSKQA